MARPRKITRPVLKKLEDGFLKGLSDREACLYAGIVPQTLYNYCKIHKEFLERKELLKNQVKIRAKLNVAHEIEKGSIDLSLWYLERKAKDEFSTKQQIEHTGKDGGPIKTEQSIDLSALSDEELTALETIVNKSANDSSDQG